LLLGFKGRLKLKKRDVSVLLIIQMQYN
jgi:hypothetical protein